MRYSTIILVFALKIKRLRGGCYTGVISEVSSRKEDDGIYVAPALRAARARGSPVAVAKAAGAGAGAGARASILRRHASAAALAGPHVGSQTHVQMCHNCPTESLVGRRPMDGLSLQATC